VHDATGIIVGDNSRVDPANSIHKEQRLGSFDPFGRDWAPRNSLHIRIDLSGGLLF
jgi:hypothetical protein